MTDEYVSQLAGPQMDAALLAVALHDPEAWAIGKRGGIDVPSTDPTYQNNAKYYAEHTAGNVAPDYTGTAPYPEGCLRIYQSDLYQAKQAIASAETFDPAKWDRVDLSELIAALETGKIDKVSGALSGHLPSLKADGTLEDSGIMFLIAAYGTTPYEDITTALSYGARLFAVKDDNLFTYYGEDSNSRLVFTCIGGSVAAPSFQFMRVDPNDNWDIQTSFGATDTHLAAKADKVASATSGNLAALNGSGNLVDSGKRPADFASAITDTASGAIASFPDGANAVPVKSLIGYINPVQDLHRLSNPYPAGGGKNLLPMTVAGIKALNTTGTWSGNTYTANGITFNLITDNGGNVIGITASGTASGNANLYVGNNLTFDSATILNGCPSGGSYNASYSIWAIADPYQEYVDAGDGLSLPSGTYASVAARIRSGYSISGTLTFYPMIRLSTESDATFAPYSNFCPISGYTGMNVTRAGKNLIDNSKVQTGKRVNITNGNLESNPDFACTDYIEVFPLTTYTENWQYWSGGNYGMVFYDANKTFISGQKQASEPGHPSDSLTFTTPSGAKYVRLSLALDTVSPETIQLELGSTATAYEAYQGTVIPISWQTEAGTVYGGYLNVTTGVLTVDKASKNVIADNVYSISSNSYRQNGDYIGGYDVTNIKRNASTASLVGALSNELLEVPLQTQFAATTSDFAIGASNARIQICVAGITTLANLKTWLTNNPLQVVYYLATPVTYQLTPTEVEALLGQNNIWVDTNGNVDVEYRADTKLYIDKKLGA